MLQGLMLFPILMLSTLSFAGDLDALLKLSQERFALEVGTVNTSIKIEISPNNCLRTGYNRKTKTVIFCPNTKIINAGLDSKDVIHHEFFHALLCAYQADLCLDNGRDDVHEALADAFAYKLNPDARFGENYYKDFPYIRKYHTSWRVGLVQSEHERGIALASQMIASKKELREFLPLFSQPIKDEVVITAFGRETSKLNRYRLKVGEELKLSFIFDARAQVNRIQWSLPAGMSLEEAKKFDYVLTLDQEITSAKGYVRYLSLDGKELGRSTFYFGSKLD